MNPPRDTTDTSAEACAIQLDAMWRQVFAALLFAGILLAGCKDGSQTPSPASTSNGQADGVDPAVKLAKMTELGQWTQAEKLVQSAMIAHPDNPDVLTNAARVAAGLERKREAANLLVDAARAANYRPVSRVDFAVQALIDVGEIYSVIDLLEHSLVVHPKNDQHRRMLVGFLGEIQRLEKIPAHLEQLIRHRAFDVHLLAGVTETSTRRFSAKTCETLLKRAPHDHRVRLSEALELLEDHDANSAAKVLKEILARHPDFAPAHAMYGQALIEQNDFDSIKKWIGAAPTEAADYADYWLTLGDIAEHEQRYDAAIRSYIEAARRDSANAAAWTRLVRSIRQLKASASPLRDSITDSELKAIQSRLTELIQFRHRYEDFETSDKKSQRLATDIARSLLAIGRVWEAEAWSAVAMTLVDDKSNELTRVRQEITAQLAKDQAWISKAAFAPLAINIDKFSDPASEIETDRPVRKLASPRIEPDDHIRMSEESDAWGLTGFGTDNNPDNSELSPLIRSTAAGGGVIDFDLDGRPDVIVMGAGGTKRKQDSKPNELLRHLGDQFLPVTSMADLIDRSYGQGVAVGDVNEDGFPDLFFANIGRNRLFGNNGDGTFSDWSDRLGGNDRLGWSTCGVFVDINGDAINDLLTINYCDANASIEVGCENEEGIPGPCPPLEYKADGDEFYLGSPTGEFVNQTKHWTKGVLPGRGLGILAGKLDGKNQSVYIANDMSENAFYAGVSSTSGANESFDVQESAVARGIAVDGRTLAQASMGIAATDYDSDGDLDLYVTGFSGEYNILYEQISSGIWTDVTTRVGLVQPTLDVLGFGTQAIDLDDDGIDELIVTNGHIEDFPNEGALPYRQPLQIFRRDNKRSFHIVNDDHWGDYFEQPHVGRAMWKADVNDDGRSDIMLTHAAEQVRLLVNRTAPRFHHASFRLIGTSCSRDAIGAIIRFKVAGYPRILWLLAGDGYLCSNERVLRAGIGDQKVVSDVEVTWPDGSVNHLGDLEGDRQYLIIQGQDRVWEERHYENPDQNK